MSTGPSTGPVGLIGSDWLIGLRQNHLFIFAIAYLVIPSLELSHYLNLLPLYLAAPSV